MLLLNVPSLVEVASAQVTQGLRAIEVHSAFNIGTYNLIKANFLNHSQGLKVDDKQLLNVPSLVKVA